MWGVWGERPGQQQERHWSKSEISYVTAAGQEHQEEGLTARGDKAEKKGVQLHTKLKR